MADRYTYLSAVGLFVAFAWSIPAPPPRLRPAVAGAASTVLLVLGALAWRQAGLWSDEERLYRHTLAVTGPNSRMNAVLAVFLRSRGRIGEAYEHILEANRIWPGNPPDLVNLGIIAHEAGHPEMADRALRSAVESGPRYVPGWYALADHLRKTGRPAEAIEAFRQVVRVQPGHGVAWSELGIQLHQAGRTEEAAVAFAEAVRIAPSDPLVQRNAGVFHALVGNWPLAMDAFSRADRLKPGDPDVLRRLGLAQAEAGDRAGALRTADRLAPLDPRGAAIVRARAGSLPN
jgi:Flp pilus assembly protein TadD